MSSNQNKSGQSNIDKDKDQFGSSNLSGKAGIPGQQGQFGQQDVNKDKDFKGQSGVGSNLAGSSGVGSTGVNLDKDKNLSSNIDKGSRSNQ